AYFIFGNTILLPICIVATILLPLFTVIVVITQFKKYSNLYQPLTALANFLAAFLMIYATGYVMKNATFLTFGIVALTFFIYLLLRIRFKISIFVNITYVILCEIFAI